MIYLDNAATSYPKPEAVYKAMDEANRNMAFNAGRGSYKVAREATRLIEETKAKLLKLVNATERGKVAFTPSITIALNEILQGIDFREGDNLYLSPYEHNAVARVAEMIRARIGINVIQIPIDAETLEIDIDKLQYLCTKQIPKAVCCIHASNVTGYVLPVKEIFDVVKKYDAITILDSAQSLGTIPVDTERIKADYVAFAGHKALMGPFGIGGFIDMGDYRLNPVIAGGTGTNSLNLQMPPESPEKYESSSNNIVAIAGLNAALDALNSDMNNNNEIILRNELTQRLSHIDKLTVYGIRSTENIGVLSMNIFGFKSDEIGEILDNDYGICVRTGYHCAPFIHSYLKDKDSNGTIRVSVGKYSTHDDINKFVSAIEEIVEG